MKVNRTTIETQIYCIINDKFLDNEILMNVVGLATKRFKISSGLILSYLNYSKPLNLATQLELYIICESINTYFKEKIINISEMFTDIEINSYSKEALDIITEYSDNKIVFKNVFMINPQHFIVNLVEYKQFYDIMNNGLLTYNFKTQRQAKYYNYKNNKYKKPFLNQNSVKEIFQLMINKEFYSNAISFNVRYLTGVENIVYNKIKNELTITIDEYTFLDIVDGYHRLIALIKAYKMQVNNTMQLNIFHHTESNINKFIIQESKINKIHTDHLIKLNENDEWVALAKAINDTGTPKTNILHKQIMESNNSNINLKDFVKRLKDSFEKYYNNPADAIKIKNYVINRFNEFYIDNEYETYKKTFDEISREFKKGG